MAGIGAEALSIADVLRPHLVRAERVLDLSQGHAELIDPSSLPERIEYIRPEPDDLEEGVIGTGTLLILFIGKDQSDGGESFEAFGAIRRLAAGGRFAIAVGGPLDHETGRELVDRLAMLDCYVLEIDPVGGAGLRAVLLGVREGERPTAEDNDAAGRPRSGSSTCVWPIDWPSVGIWSSWFRPTPPRRVATPTRYQEPSSGE